MGGPGKQVKAMSGYNHTVAPGMSEPCGYCGLHHSGVCSLVSAIEYHPNGMVKRVEFHRPTQVVSVESPTFSWGDSDFPSAYTYAPTFTTGGTGDPS